MIPIDELLEPLDAEEVAASILQLAKDIGLPVTAWKTGDPPKAIISIFSAWITGTYNSAVLPLLKSFFLDKSEGSLLRTVALVFWGVKPKDASFATGSITIENRGLFPVNIAVDSLAVKNANDKVFKNTTGGFLAAWSGVGAYPTLTVDVEAVEAGSASNTALNTILPDLANGPVNVYVVSNTDIIGSDEESDDSLKDRIRNSTGILSPNGPRSAYEYVALSTRIPGIPANTETDRTLVEKLLVSRDGDVPVNVNRVRVTQTGSGTASVYLASPAGAAEGDIFTPGSDVYLVNQAIQLLCVPIGFQASVVAASEVPITKTLTVYVRRESNLTEADATTAVTDKIQEFFENYPVGGRRLIDSGPLYFLTSEFLCELQAAAPGIYLVTATDPSDVSMDADEVATNNVTFTVNVVTQQ